MLKTNKNTSQIMPSKCQNDWDSDIVTEDVTTVYTLNNVVYSSTLDLPNTNFKPVYWVPDNAGSIMIRYPGAFPESRRYSQKEECDIDDHEVLQVLLSMQLESTPIMIYNSHSALFSWAPMNNLMYTTLNFTSDAGLTNEMLLSLTRKERNLHVVRRQLNGNNGSWTNTDDVKTQGVSKAEIAKRIKQSNRDKALSGRGAYKFSKAAKVAGSVGGKLGGKKGKIAAKIGTEIARRSLQASGLGDYSFSGAGSYEAVANNTITGISHSDVPTFGYAGDTHGDMALSYTEYVGKLFSPSPANSFGLVSLSVNPGLPGVFQWLSQIASNYQQYEFDGLICTFLPSTGLITSGSMGFITMVFTYNPADDNPTSETQIKNMAGQVTGTPITKIMCGCECDKAKMLVPLGRYIRSGATPSGQDIKTYDTAKLWIGLYGINSTAFPANTQLGELHWSYRVKLIKPKLYDTLGFSTPTDSFWGATGITTALPLGTIPYKSSNNFIGGRLTTTSSQVYTFPDQFAGTVWITQFCYGTSPVVNTFGLSGAITVQSNYIDSAGTANTPSYATSGSANSIRILVVKVNQATTSGGNSVLLTLASGSAFTSAMFMITQVNPLIGQPIGGYVAA